MNLVDRLRTDELESIRSECENGRRDHILKSLDERGNAQALIRQQYTGRYPFELLQNANDAAGDSGRPGRVVFKLTENALLVGDNGAGFGDDQVRAICGLGRSSKDPRKSVGYKGLGFKSVGEITARPQICSGDTWFEFDEQRARHAVEEIVGTGIDKQRLPTYAMPFRLGGDDLGPDADEVRSLAAGGPSPSREELATVLRFPFKHGVTRAQVDQHLTAILSPRLLLFLDSIEELVMDGTDADFVAVATRQSTDNRIEVLIETGDKIDHWLVFRRPIPIHDRSLTQPLGDAWAQVEQVHVAAAVKITDDSEPAAHQPEPLHVYFPTEDHAGFGVMLQGDFALDLDRRHIGRSPEMAPYNTWLATALGELVAREVAPSLATRFPLSASVVTALAPRREPTGPVGQTVFDTCMEHLHSVAFVPGIDGTSRTPAASTLLPRHIPDPAVAHHHLELSDLGHLALPAIEIDSYARTLLSDHLDVQELDLTETVSRLAPPVTTSRTDNASFFEFLVDWSDAVGIKTFAPLLGDVACVPTQGGGCVSPTSGVFFPRQRDAMDLPGDLDIPVANLPEVDGLTVLLDAAGVKPFAWRELILDHVLPKLEDERTAVQDRQTALAALRAYYRSQRGGDPQIVRRVGRVLLPADGGPENAAQLQPAQQLYFPESWTGHDTLERIYRPSHQARFLAIPPPQPQPERQEDGDAPPPAETLDPHAQEMDFLAWVGVASHPRVLTAEAESANAYQLGSKLRHPHEKLDPARYKEWRDSPEFVSGVECGQGHPIDSQQLSRSHVLDGFHELVEQADTTRLALLWHELATNWGSTYEPAMRAEIRCCHGWHNGERRHTVPSLMAAALRTTAWAPCVHDGELVLVAPQHAWRVAPDTPGHLQRHVSSLHPTIDTSTAVSMSTALGVVDATRPMADDLAGLLRTLAGADVPSDHAEENSHVDRATRLTARWAMSALDDALGAGSSLSTGHSELPLLATRHGMSLFTVDAVAVDDPLLAETFQDRLPILDADRGLRRLRQALKLRQLDDEIQRHPDATGHSPERQEAISRHLERVKPFLAAVAIDSNPSMQDAVLRGLQRLELVVCTRLTLRYVLGDHEVPRTDATSFIDERILSDPHRRRIGTAYLELDPDTGLPHWYGFGPQLAGFLGVPRQGDAFSVLLSGTDTDCHRFLIARRIDPTVVDDLRLELHLPAPEDDPPPIPDIKLVPPIGTATSPAQPPAPTPTPPPEPPGPPEDIVFPEVDPDTLDVIDASHVETFAPGPEPPPGPPTPGPPGPVDFDRSDRHKRALGTRGEELVVQAEQRRLTREGADPDLVVWEAERHPYSPFDIKSMEDHHPIYIEVKATTGADPRAAFDISPAELRMAAAKRSSYYVYRVLEAHTAHPRIIRYDDPIGRLGEDRAQLTASGARLAFADSGSPLPAAPSEGTDTPPEPALEAEESSTEP